MLLAAGFVFLMVDSAAATVDLQQHLSAWELYRWPIIAGLLFCALETTIIITLLIHRAKHKHDEASLRQDRDAQQHLTGLLLRARDDERRRIAHDLHDETVQNLATIKADLTRVQRDLNGLENRTIEKLNDALVLSDQAIRELRTLSYLLHPPLLDELGLIPALQWFVRGFVERSGIQVEIEVRGEFHRLTADLETALFRVVQESLSNIHRHSGSLSATISASQDQTSVVLQIKDRGRGFSKGMQMSHNHSSFPPGVGIMGMGERLRQLGGQLEIDSNDHGTTVTAKVPTTMDMLCCAS